MSEFKVGDDVLIKAKIVKLEDFGPRCSVVSFKGQMPHRESKVYAIPEKTYEDGLNEAWELAREIFKMDGPTMKSVFGSLEGWDAYGLPFHEAMDKVKKYKGEKEFHAGDVVKWKDGKGVVTRDYGDYGDMRKCCVLWFDGTFAICDKESLSKTGRTIDVESLLKQIGGTE